MKILNNFFCSLNNLTIKNFPTFTQIFNVSNLISLFVIHIIQKKEFLDAQFSHFLLHSHAKLLNAKILIKLNLSCLRPSTGALSSSPHESLYMIERRLIAKPFCKRAYTHTSDVHSARIRINMLENK